MSDTLKYTTQAPTAPGWYWHKLPHWEHGFIVQVWAYKRGLDDERLEVEHITNGEAYRELLADFIASASKQGGWLFAGPIPSPSEN